GDDSHRELKMLRSQMQVLRSALTEAAELDQKRAAILTRALKALGENSSAAAARTEAPRTETAQTESAETPPEPTRVAKTSAPRMAPSLPQKRVPEVTTGVVRGKVSV